VAEIWQFDLLCQMRVSCQRSEFIVRLVVNRFDSVPVARRHLHDFCLEGLLDSVAGAQLQSGRGLVI